MEGTAEAETTKGAHPDSPEAEENIGRYGKAGLAPGLSSFLMTHVLVNSHEALTSATTSARRIDLHGSPASREHGPSRIRGDGHLDPLRAALDLRLPHAERPITLKTVSRRG